MGLHTCIWNLLIIYSVCDVHTAGEEYQNMTVMTVKCPANQDKRPLLAAIGLGSTLKTMPVVKITRNTSPDCKTIKL